MRSRSPSRSVLPIAAGLNPAAMAPFSPMTRLWLPWISLFALCSPLLDWPLGIAPVLLLLGVGYLLQARQLNLSLDAILVRRANQITLGRLILLLTGLGLLRALPGPAGIVLVWSAFALDAVDGRIARRMPATRTEREYGAWMDRESDAAALLAAALFLVGAGAPPEPLLIIGLSRYAWGLFFLILPLPMPSARRFGLFSRAAAAFAQAATAAAFLSLLPSAVPAAIPAGLLLLPLYPAALLITLSFSIELVLRLKLFIAGAGPGWPGLLRSFLIYYRLPFRYRRMRRFYARFLKPGDIAFDIGAHLGNRIPPWLSLGVAVVAVEPQPGCGELLRCWYGDRSGCRIIAAAAGEVPGRERLLLCRSYPTLTSLSAEWVERIRRDSRFAGIEWEDDREIEVVTLARLREEYGEPAFVKIDVEGFEARVLAGAGERPLAALSFELLPAAAESALECIALLERRGAYHYNFSPGEGMRFRYSDWIDAATLRARLDSLVAEGRSGDIYAELQPADGQSG